MSRNKKHRDYRRRVGLINVKESESKTNNEATIYDHDTICSIYIEDYEDSEMLRIMLQFRHYFHRDYVDVWLKINTLCLVCRNSLVEISNNVMDSFILQKPNNVCNASRDKTHKNPLRQIGLCNEDRDR
ncbi:hypothetical protein JHK84_051336 [Glycine max]|nr:hypothetical protein JHK84_051336 [Glycine max]